jgi:tetratricopeptide (TPR) repeat protein
MFNVRNLLTGFLLFVFIYQNAESQPEIVPNIINPIEGDLSKDNPGLPSFYMWYKTQPNNNDSPFKLFLVREEGSLQPVDLMGETYEEWNLLGERRNKKLALNLESSEPYPSIDGKWEVFPQNKDAEPGDISLRYENMISHVVRTVRVPDYINDPTYDWYWPIIWNPYKDLFYLGVSGGADTGRIEYLYQFDPATGEFIFLNGFENEALNFSRDGQWVIFGNCIFNTETKKYYFPQALADGWDGIFYQWTDVANCIEKGRKCYFNHQFSEAITDYQKAIDLDPENVLAYELMGYSYLRSGRAIDAISTLKKSLEISPDYIMSHYNLALAYWSNHDLDNAVKEITQVYLLDRNRGLVEDYKNDVYEDPQFKEILNTPEYKQAIKFMGVSDEK